MSSLEIADLTGKNHADVMRDIRRTLDEAEIGQSKFASTYTDKQGKPRSCYHLPRFECDLVISGYSVKYRAAIIRRWHELEADRLTQPKLSRRDELIRELAVIDSRELGASIVDAIRPIHKFGSMAANGNRRVGLRRAAWVATRRSRLEEALAIHRELRALDQAELALGLTEGGAV